MPPSPPVITVMRLVRSKGLYMLFTLRGSRAVDLIGTAVGGGSSLAKITTARKATDAKRSLLDMGLKMVLLGSALFVASMFLGSNPMLAPVVKGIRIAAPWAVFVGALLLALYYAVRRVAVPTIAKQPDPIVFGQSTTTFQEPPPPVVVREREPAALAARAPASAWCAKVFEDIEWRRFEAVCGALFAQAGFEARTQSHGPDGGLDIWLHSRHAAGPAAIVQCKHWRKPVGVKEIREFFGVMTSRGVKRGTFATTSTFTADALRFAKENGISALDRDGLLALIAKRSEEQQQQLLRVAYEGDYWRPTCASCGIKMADKSPRAGGSKFWGCPNFPRCRTVLTMR